MISLFATGGILCTGCGGSKGGGREEERDVDVIL